MLDKSSRDGKIEQKEFIEYYRNIGASIDNDQFFELMITNAWNLNDKSYSRGWGSQYWTSAMGAVLFII